MRGQKSYCHAFLCFCSFLTVFSIEACDNGNPIGSSPRSTVILPLSSGNRWEQAVLVYDTAGTIIDESAIIITELGRDTLMYGRQFFLDGSLWWTNMDSGAVYINQTTLEVFGPKFTLRFKYPAMAGDVYQSDGYDVRVSTIDTVIQVPAGLFRCIKYEFSHVMRLWDEYVSPDKGVVKSVMYFANRYPKDPMKIQYVDQLKSYRLN